MRHRSLLPCALLLAACQAPAPVAPSDPVAGGPRTFEPPAAATHPLDPLTADEVRAATAILRAGGRLPEGAFVPLLVLAEPGKPEVAAFERGEAPPRREAFAVVLDRRGNATGEALLDLPGRRELSWRQVAAQPNVLAEEFTSVPEIVRRDPAWREAMLARGIRDFDQVLIDAWAAGVIPVEGARPGARLARAISFWRGQDENPYGRPIEGVVAVVDVNEGRVVRVLDSGVRPVSRRNQDFGVAAVGSLRAAPRPLRVSQPEGPSFEVRGQEVRWQKWVFRFALHPREGLVLYRVGWEDQGRVRSILHRASISEMVVPYGDPDANWAWRNAFDEGEYGLGRLANSLVPDQDAPTNAAYFHALMADELGAPKTLERGVALWERDGEVLWTHYDMWRSRTEARRARELVLYCTVTVGNYDYGLAWIFHQDGTLEAEVMASGILLAKGTETHACGGCEALVRGEDAVPPGDERTGTLVDRGIVAPNHQHFFSFRLDFDVDGERNSVVEMDTRALPPGPDNPHHNGFGLEERLLRTEAEGARDLSFREHRMWKVVNPAVRNELGHLAGYRLIPGENSLPYMGEQAATRRRAGFVAHHLWVTRFHPEETWAAGPYPNQNPAGDGLPRWVADGEALVGEDVVVWYTLGLTHVPRPEEWPIMSAARMGFKLAPAGFFSRNPALDVPPEGAR